MIAEETLVSKTITNHRLWTRATASLDTAHGKVHQNILCQLVDFTHVAEAAVFKETVCCMVILS